MDLHHLNDSNAIDQIRADDLDVLIDLTGLTTFSRPAIACARPAPIVLNYLGFPGSQGSCYVDGLIADAALIPAEQEANYPEQVLRLPHAFSSRWRQPMAGITRSSFGLPDEAFVFCCFNRGDKINCRHLLQLDDDPGGGARQLALAGGETQGAADAFRPRRRNAASILIASWQLPTRSRCSVSSLPWPAPILFLDTAGFNAGAIGVLALNAGLPLDHHRRRIASAPAWAPAFAMPFINRS